jgi:aminobenzoyl-glutamate utilization protein B
MKGMIFAAKAMALTAFDLLTQPQLLAQAQAEFKALKGADRYVTPLPDEVLLPA